MRDVRWLLRVVGDRASLARTPGQPGVRRPGGGWYSALGGAIVADRDRDHHRQHTVSAPLTQPRSAGNTIDGEFPVDPEPLSPGQECAREEGWRELLADRALRLSQEIEQLRSEADGYWQLDDDEAAQMVEVGIESKERELREVVAEIRHLDAHVLPQLRRQEQRWSRRWARRVERMRGPHLMPTLIARGRGEARPRERRSHHRRGNSRGSPARDDDGPPDDDVAAAGSGA
jgi:hypothetical protein